MKAGELIATIESDDLQAAAKAAEATAASDKWKLSEAVETERQNAGRDVERDSKRRGASESRAGDAGAGAGQP